MKGFKDSNKNFHPIKSYKKVTRKKREPFDITKDGVKISQKQLVSMQRQPRKARENLTNKDKQILRDWVKQNPNWKSIDDLPNKIFIPLVSPAKDDIDKRVAIQMQAIEFMKQVTKELNKKERKARTFEVTDPTGNEGFPDLETELNDIFDEVADIDSGEINLLQLRKSAQENIEFILKREKKIKAGDKIDVTLVDAREETGRDEFKRTGRGESGFYQYDYNIRRNGKLLPFSGTAFGTISAGDVIDMELEFYDLSRMTVKEIKS